MDELVVEKVLTAVDQVPPGRVVSYGDIAALVGTGPRQVGSVMSHHGAGVAWWRVTSHAGDIVAHSRQRALEHWATEGIELKPNGLGCRIAQYRADLVQLADDYEAAIGVVLEPDHDQDRDQDQEQDQRRDR
ncbi:MGMT family protein [Propionibacteriaceae bacterium Y2011]|uniref:MGMT family protein n=1 Tax=Microlunatus sp. Y2014 TaxID=3418488 RepID=UPI003B451B50